jgi:DNA-binding transcriptional regulator YiaG
MLPPQARAERPGLLKTAFVTPDWVEIQPMPARDRRQLVERASMTQTTATARRDMVQRLTPSRGATPVASGATTSRLASLRIAAGVTLARAERTLGVEPGTVAKWENGRPPKLTSGHIDAMATLYRVDREHILAACRVR